MAIHFALIFPEKLMLVLLSIVLLFLRERLQKYFFPILYIYIQIRSIIAIFLDDEPDGENDPKHYIILSGFTDASLLSFLIEMKVHVKSIISIKTEYHIKLLKDSKSEEGNNIDEVG